jgi:hypothetical protein
LSKSLLTFFLPYLALVGIFWEISLRQNSRLDKRDSFLFGFVIWGSFVVLLTEGLSLLKLLQRNALLISWTFLLITFLGIYFYTIRKRIGKQSLGIYLRSIFPSFPKHYNSWIAVMIAAIAILMLTQVEIAVIYPPNNYDSMTYHLARVLHWAQNHSVQHYATHIERQIMFAPFAEFILTHIYVITGTDRFVNLAQWFSMVICIIGVSSITKKLGATTIQQAIASLLCAFIPMGILQSTSTQNDLVLSACLVCLVIFSFYLWENPHSKFFIIGLGLSLGLSILTKATAFIFALPLCLLIGIYLLIKLNWRAISIGTIIILLAGIVNIGHFSRNITLYGSPIGSDNNFIFSTRNELLTPAALASNIIRNTAQQLFTNSDNPILSTTSDYLLSSLRLLHQFTGLSTTDPRTSWKEKDVFTMGSYFTYSEDYSSNFFHTILIFLAFIAWLFGYAHNVDKKKFRIYMMILLAGFLIFCLYLKWQEYGSRLLLPLFILWCPIIAGILFQSRKKLALFIPLLIALFSANWVINNNTRPLTPDAIYATKPRDELYFSVWGDLYTPYTEIANNISSLKCEKVGLIIDEDTWEYPLWILLKDRGFNGKIEHIRVHNLSAKYEQFDFNPCAIISTSDISEIQQEYRNIQIGDYYLYLKN